MKSENFDPYYIAEVLSDLLSRQYGRSIVIELSKKADRTGARPAHPDHGDAGRNPLLTDIVERSERC